VAVVVVAASVEDDEVMAEVAGTVLAIFQDRFFGVSV
jgi:hypothetical protein